MNKYQGSKFSDFIKEEDMSEEIMIKEEWAKGGIPENWVRLEDYVKLQDALRRALEDGPENSLHEQGGVRRIMTWKESSEMLESCSNRLSEELTRTQKLRREDLKKLRIMKDAIMQVCSNHSVPEYERSVLKEALLKTEAP